MKKPIKKFLPYILIALLVLAAGAIAYWTYRTDRTNKPKDKLVVDLSLPIEKSKEETNKITVPAAGGTSKEKIQIKFTWKAGDMSYSDALYFSPEEYAKLTPEQIEKMKMERMKNWADTVNEASRQSQ